MKYLSVLLFFGLASCLFQLEDPPIPGGVFHDRFSFKQILEISSSTDAQFVFGSYDELFFDTIPFFIDYTGEVFDRDAFITRLNQLDAQEILISSWGPSGVSDGPVLEAAPPVELALRSFNVVVGSGGATESFAGVVRIWVRYNGIRWQIVQWREADGKKTIFHPEFVY